MECHYETQTTSILIVPVRSQVSRPNHASPRIFAVNFGFAWHFSWTSRTIALVAVARLAARSTGPTRNSVTRRSGRRVKRHTAHRDGSLADGHGSAA